ncbi:uncharacterized protein V1516DRAFT_199379 [Lipomyces oligophaga]|uniref:uncharacterized protein n=1 Tax=Lipomyces oligophaga TaxID=45792 RepID=UPI0034CE4D55
MESPAYSAGPPAINTNPAAHSQPAAAQPSSLPPSPNKYNYQLQQPIAKKVSDSMAVSQVHEGLIAVPSCTVDLRDTSSEKLASKSTLQASSLPVAKTTTTTTTTTTTITTTTTTTTTTANSGSRPQLQKLDCLTSFHDVDPAQKRHDIADLQLLMTDHHSSSSSAATKRVSGENFNESSAYSSSTSSQAMHVTPAAAAAATSFLTSKHHLHFSPSGRGLDHIAPQPTASVTPTSSSSSPSPKFSSAPPSPVSPAPRTDSAGLAPTLSGSSRSSPPIHTPPNRNNPRKQEQNRNSTSSSYRSISPVSSIASSSSGRRRRIRSISPNHSPTRVSRPDNSVPPVPPLSHDFILSSSSVSPVSPASKSMLSSPATLKQSKSGAITGNPFDGRLTRLPSDHFASSNLNSGDSSSSRQSENELSAVSTSNTRATSADETVVIIPNDNINRSNEEVSGPLSSTLKTQQNSSNETRDSFSSLNRLGSFSSQQRPSVSIIRQQSYPIVAADTIQSISSDLGLSVSRSRSAIVTGVGNSSTLTTGELNDEVERLRDDIVARREEKRRRREQEKRKQRELLEDDKVLVGRKVAEGHVNYILAYNMLTGIRVAVSRTSSKVDRVLTDADFTTKHKLAFDINGNEMTPSAKYAFKFKDYAPWVFRHLRELFQIDPADYLISLTSNYIVSEMGSPGKSGSFFYFSRDYRYIIKTIHHSEHKFLLKILKEYYHHVKANPNTLISQFYGLHRVKLPYGRKIHFIIMNNLFPPHRDIHETFDLKGSTFGRDYDEEKLKRNKHATMKDLNWARRDRHIQLGPLKRRQFVQQLDADVKFLERLHIMDYSLLIGIHDIQKGNTENIRDSTLSMFTPHEGMLIDLENPSGVGTSIGSGGMERHSSGTGGSSTGVNIANATGGGSGSSSGGMERRVTLKRAFSTVAAVGGSGNGAGIGGGNSNGAGGVTTGGGATSATLGQVRDELPLDEIPGRKNFKFYADDGGYRATDERNAPVNEIYYLGVIDCLTHYSFAKKLETFWKSMSHPREELSAIPPYDYGERFLRFIETCVRTTTGTSRTGNKPRNDPGSSAAAGSVVAIVTPIPEVDSEE